MVDIIIDSNSVDFVVLDGKTTDFATLDDKLLEIITEQNIDINEYSISNKYLRAIVKKKGYEYHVLEKACGVTPIYCIEEKKGQRVELKMDLPYTIMVVKLKYLNGEYTRISERIFHSNVPVDKNLSNSLWRWHFTNVYDSYNICWGNGEALPKVDTQTSYKLIDEFFLASKNNDLQHVRNFRWSDFSPSEIHKVDIKKLNKLPYTLTEAINQF